MVETVRRIASKTFALFVMSAFIGVCAGCGGGSPTSPSSSSGGSTASSFDCKSGAVQDVGVTSKGEGYVWLYCNLNSIEPSIADYNGWQGNLFVTNTDTNRVHKYVADYPNSSLMTRMGNQPSALILRDIDFGSSVKFELRFLFKGVLPYTQATYPRRNDPVLFSMLPSSLHVGGDYFTTGPLPKMDSATSSSIDAQLSSQTGSYRALTDQELSTIGRPKTCEVPAGATDCVAK